MNEQAIFAELRRRAWQYPLVKKTDLAVLPQRHTYIYPNGVAVALSLNR